MKLSEVKRVNRVIGVLLAVGVTYATGLDVWLRRLGGPALLLCALLPFFVLFPLLVEYLERKFVK